jgi:hypothetical protein
MFAPKTRELTPLGEAISAAGSATGCFQFQPHCREVKLECTARLKSVQAEIPDIRPGTAMVSPEIVVSVCPSLRRFM